MCSEAQVRDNLSIVGGAEMVLGRGRGYGMMVEGSGSRAEWDSSTKGFRLCGVESQGIGCTKVGV